MAAHFLLVGFLLMRAGSLLPTGGRAPAGAWLLVGAALSNRLHKQLAMLIVNIT